MPARKPLQIRRARPSDKEAVLEFCRFTWQEHGDYIQKVWDEWVKDRKGFFAVATLEGEPMATAKLTVLGPGEMWLEGLRVNASYRGMGTSRVMTRFLLGKARKLRAKTVRFATGEENRVSKHVGRELGFKLLGHYSIMSASADGRCRSVFSPVFSPRGVRREANTDDMVSIVSASYFARAMRLLASEGWTFVQVDGDFILDSLRRRELFVARRPGPSAPARLGFLVASRGRAGTRLNAKLFADIDKGALYSMILGTRRLAYELELPRVRLVVPKTRKLLATAEQAGFQEDDPGFYHGVMEKRLSSGRQVLVKD
ncbi:MAG: GNAT family N-acetyltransferase [Candidatus Eiseniibacteriota bacterium]|nr:MAG: GNAT family N-acetyltransferase [Candidatus Eisenbacteria bacterium]